MSELFSKIRIPGAFWLALIAFVTTWLPELVPGADWLPLALLILAAVGKAAEVILAPRIVAAHPQPGPAYTMTTTTANGEQLRSYTAPAGVELEHAGKVTSFLFG